MKCKLSWSAFKADFDMNRVTSVYFWKSEWERFDPHDHTASVSVYYYIYRFLYVAFFIGAFIQNFICIPPDNFYFLFLTNLTFLLQLIYATLFFLYVSYKVLTKRTARNNNEYHFHEQQYRLPLICKVIWTLHNVLVVVPYVVTSIYWIILFPQDGPHDTVCEFMTNFLVHGMNSPLALLESFVVAIPIRRTHVIYTMIAGFGYSTFTGLYEVFNGQYGLGRDFIYPILDWKSRPGLAAGTCFVVIFIISVILHFVMGWGVYKLRIYLKCRLCSRSDNMDVGQYGSKGEENRGYDAENKSYHKF